MAHQLLGGWPFVRFSRQHGPHQQRLLGGGGHESHRGKIEAMSHGVREFWGLCKKGKKKGIVTKFLKTDKYLLWMSRGNRLGQPSGVTTQLRERANAFHLGREWGTEHLHQNHAQRIDVRLFIVALWVQPIVLDFFREKKKTFKKKERQQIVPGRNKFVLHFYSFAVVTAQEKRTLPCQLLRCVENRCAFSEEEGVIVLHCTALHCETSRVARHCGNLPRLYDVVQTRQSAFLNLLSRGKPKISDFNWIF